MSLKHIFLALLVVVVWGLNFIFVRIILNECPPLLLCALRFFLVSIPLVFFMPYPQGHFRWVAVYGLLMFALQFALLFTGIYLGVMPGLASIVMQTQVFFSMFFAMMFLNEKIALPQLLGAFVSFSGIALFGLHLDSAIDPIGLVLIIAAAATWGLGNLITKKLVNAQGMSVIAWGGLVAALPMLLLSLMFEGTDQLTTTFHKLSITGGVAFLYIAFVSTYIGYGIWNWLLERYPVNNIVPFSLLVPVVAVICSMVFLGEPFERWKFFAGALVILGLGIHLVGMRLYVKRSSLQALPIKPSL